MILESAAVADEHRESYVSWSIGSTELSTTEAAAGTVMENCADAAARTGLDGYEGVCGLELQSLVDRVAVKMLHHVDVYSVVA